MAKDGVHEEEARRGGGKNGTRDRKYNLANGAVSLCVCGYDVEGEMDVETIRVSGYSLLLHSHSLSLKYTLIMRADEVVAGAARCGGPPVATDARRWKEGKKRSSKKELGTRVFPSHGLRIKNSPGKDIRIMHRERKRVISH